MIKKPFKKDVMEKLRLHEQTIHLGMHYETVAITSFAKKSKNFQIAFDCLRNAYDPDKVVIRYMKKRTVLEVTAKQLFDDIDEKSSTLFNMGLVRKHIAVIGENSYDWLVWYYAILNLGSVAVLLSKDYSLEQIVDAVESTDVDALVYDTELEIKINADELKTIKMIDMNIMPEGDNDGYSHFVSEAVPEDLGSIMLTSGTTEKNKAVMLSNRAIMTGASDYFINDEYASVLIVLPLHHVAGIGFALNSLFRGMEFCLGKNVQDFLRCISIMNPECIMMVPALANLLLKRISKQKSFLNDSLKVLICGGAAFPVKILDLKKEHEIKIWQCYASTETFGRGLVCEMLEDNKDVLGCVAEDVEATIVDRELWIKGNSLMMGYYKDPESTEESFVNGWYRTGDYCEKKSNGYYYLIGRKKNLIILLNGENVSPEEIEKTLLLHKEIQEILVYEDQDAISSKIYPSYEECMTEEDRESLKNKVNSIIEDYNNEVPTYKQIQKVLISEEPLEKTDNNKIKRY